METSRNPALVIVNGHPATGKTTFARNLAEVTGFPLFTKDSFKETLHEAFGAADREESRRLGRASYSLLQLAADTVLSAGHSLIIESNFDSAGSGHWIGALEERYSPVTVQVFLSAEPGVIVQRYAQRSVERHPAHFDDVAVDELRERLRKPYPPLMINGHTLEFDTTDYSRFNSEEAISQVSMLLARNDAC